MGMWDIADNLLGAGGVVAEVGPWTGPIVNGAKAVTHAGMAGIDYLAGDNENAKDHLSMSALDAVKAIPGLGAAVGVGEQLYDLHAGRPTEEHLWDPSAPVRQQTLQQDVREWMFGRRTDGKETEGLW